MLPRSLEPVQPSAAVKGRVLEAVAGPVRRSAPVFTRVFWAVAAIVLFSAVVSNLRRPLQTHALDVKGAGQVRGRVQWTGNSVEFAVSGLPALPAGKCWQLWHIQGNAVIAQATFTAAADGTVGGWDLMKNPISTGCAFALTMEPAGGSARPTMPIYALAKD